MKTITPYIRKSGRGANKKHELSLQHRVVRYLKTEYPNVDFMSDWAAGAYMPISWATERKRLQSGRGWPDMFIASPQRGYSGLFIELKKEGTTIYVSKGQRKGLLSQDKQIVIEGALLDRLNKLGYLARFSVGYDNTIKLIDWYFNREKPVNTELF